MQTYAQKIRFEDYLTENYLVIYQIVQEKTYNK